MKSISEHNNITKHNITTFAFEMVLITDKFNFLPQK